MNEITTTIASAVDEQRAATDEIFRNVQHAADGTMSVNEKIGEVDRAAGETGQAAQQVLSSSQDLANQSERLREAVSAFLKDVRAA